MAIFGNTWQYMARHGEKYLREKHVSFVKNVNYEEKNYCEKIYPLKALPLVIPQPLKDSEV